MSTQHHPVIAQPRLLSLCTFCAERLEFAMKNPTATVHCVVRKDAWLFCFCVHNQVHAALTSEANYFVPCATLELAEARNGAYITSQDYCERYVAQLAEAALAISAHQDAS